MEFEFHAQNHKTVFICPLDWGLGHATRCVPIINACIQIGLHVILGACGNQIAFFKNEFPNLRIIESPSYRIKYPKKGWLMPLWLLKEIPRLARVRYKEHTWLEEICRQYSIDLVISDNRFGCFSKKVRSIYITHQVRIAMPQGLQFLEPLGQVFHKFLQNSFSEVWIPDFAGTPNLGGRLSHRGIQKGFHFFIGTQTRFAPNDLIQVNKEYEWLILISGPEPQRTLFEEACLQAFKNYSGKVILARGLPGIQEQIENTSSMEIHNHLASKDLQEVIQKSQYVLCRSGYSTLMDLQVLGANALLVPTPGQTEQVVLANSLWETRQCGFLDQDQITLENIEQQKSMLKGFSKLSQEQHSLTAHLQRNLVK